MVKKLIFNPVVTVGILNRNVTTTTEFVDKPEAPAGFTRNSYVVHSGLAGSGLAPPMK